MFTKNKTHLTLHLFTLGRVFFPENRFKSSERRKRERKEYTNGWKRPDPRVPPILNSAPIQKHLVDLQTRVSSTLQSIQTAAFQLLLPFSHLPLSNKDREGNRAKIIESLPPSNSLLNSLFFSRRFRSSTMSKVEFAKMGGRRKEQRDSWSGPVVVPDRYSAFKSVAPDGASGFGRSLRNLK